MFAVCKVYLLCDIVSFSLELSFLYQLIHSKAKLKYDSCNNLDLMFLWPIEISHLKYLEMK